MAVKGQLLTKFVPRYAVDMARKPYRSDVTDA
jgi:hypothetical protein